MKYAVLLMMFVATSVFASDNDYLRVESFPEQLSNSDSIDRSIELKIEPRIPEDEKFNLLFTELSKIAAIPGGGTIPVHEANLSFEIKKGSKLVRAVYTKSKVRSNEALRKRWLQVFHLMRELSNEQFNP